MYEVEYKKLAQDYELITTSYHEAGHAICGLLCFMKVDNVRIIREKRVNGETIYKNLNHIAYIDDYKLEAYSIRNEIYLCYAGLAAEKIFYKESSGSTKFPIVLRDGSSLDISTASDVIRKYSLSPAGKKRHAFKKKLFNECSELLESHWDAVTIIAHGLFKHKRLNFLKIKKLILKNSKYPDFWKKQFYIISRLYRKAFVDEKIIKGLLRI